MTDQERMAIVDRLLENIMQTHLELERKIRVYTAAAEAFLAEAERDSRSRRLAAQRQAVEKARKAAHSYYERQFKNMRAIEKALKDWKSPGREYTRFVDSAWRLAEAYSDVGDAMGVEHERIQSAIEDIEAAAK
jgi:hypothetical protein